MECDKEKTVEQGKEGGRERGRRLWRQILPGFATLALAIVFFFFLYSYPFAVFFHRFTHLVSPSFRFFKMADWICKFLIKHIYRTRTPKIMH